MRLYEEGSGAQTIHIHAHSFIIFALVTHFCMVRIYYINAATCMRIESMRRYLELFGRHLSHFRLTRCSLTCRFGLCLCAFDFDGQLYIGCGRFNHYTNIQNLEL